MDNLYMPEKKQKLEPRRSTRNNVFNLVFQLEFFDKADYKQLLNKYYELLEYEVELEFKSEEEYVPLAINKDIIQHQFFSIVENIEKIDKMIVDNTTGWSISRIDKVDLAILRLAVYEILFEDNIPNKVAINEAVELAKEYSSEKSYKFINAILAKL